MRTVILASFGLALLAASAEATPKAWDRTWELTTQADVHLIAGDAHIRIHTGPPGFPHPERYHWQVEVLPKLTEVAGFEWGSGFFINPMPPEEAAR